MGNETYIQKAITAATPVQKNWQDSKRYKWLLSPALPLLGTAALTGYAIAPKKLRTFAWFGPILFHAVLPALDYLIGEDFSNPPEEAVAALEKDPYYKWVVRAFIPAQYATTFLGAWIAGRKDIPTSDYIGLTMSVGLIGGLGINTSHELSHKHSKFERLASMLAAAPTAYTHFSVEHPYGHHKRVATPEDPASSRMGESFWKFLPRTVIGGIKSAIHIEKERLNRKGKGFWSIQNELLQGWTLSSAVFGTALIIGGRRSIPFLIGQAAYGASLLEVVNYLEHYGLLRQKDDNGKYERTRPEHSWNSNQTMSNVFLYQLQRHSDHHAHPTRSYQALRDFKDAPTLPSGYPTTMLPAYFPKLWYKLMDKRVIEHYKGDLSKINFAPERRDELMEKYADFAAQVRQKYQTKQQDGINPVSSSVISEGLS